MRGERACLRRDTYPDLIILVVCHSVRYFSDLRTRPLDRRRRATLVDSLDTRSRMLSLSMHGLRVPIPSHTATARTLRFIIISRFGAGRSRRRGWVEIRVRITADRMRTRGCPKLMVYTVLCVGVERCAAFRTESMASVGRFVLNETREIPFA